MSTTGVGFQIEYPAITLHAVSRGESGPSIYCQLDDSFGQVNGNSPENEDEDSEMRELTIIPQSSDSCMDPPLPLASISNFFIIVEPIFEALSQCASLHPDPHGEEDDLDDAILDVNGTTFDTFAGDENEELSEVGRVRSDFINDNRFAPY
jgi:chloride channel, nucleotide-sensitive, 1A